MHFRFLTIAIALVLSFVAAKAAEPGPATQIPAGGTLRGHFTEQHTFPSGKAQLKSEGHFLLAPGYGIIWKFEKPLPITVIITPKGMTQRMGDIQLPSIPATRMRILKNATALLTDALTGQWNTLETDYTIARHATSAGWQAVLAPRPTTDSPFQSITAAGAQFVETANVDENNGGADYLVFSDQAVSASSPTAPEIAALTASDPE